MILPAGDGWAYRPTRGMIATALAAILKYARGGYGIYLTEPIWQFFTAAIDRDVEELSRQLRGYAETR